MKYSTSKQIETVVRSNIHRLKNLYLKMACQYPIGFELFCIGTIAFFMLLGWFSGNVYFVYISVALLLAYLITQILIFSVRINFHTARRNIEQIEKGQSSRAIWVNKFLGGKGKKLIPGDVRELKKILCLWFVLFLFCVLMFTVAYSVVIDGHKGFRLSPKKVLVHFHTSLMAQCCVGDPAQPFSDNINVVNISSLQVMSTVLLSTIILLLVQQQVSNGIKRGTLQRYLIKLACSRNASRLRIRCILNVIGNWIMYDKKADYKIDLDADWTNFLTCKHLVMGECLMDEFMRNPRLLTLLAERFEEYLSKYLRRMGADIIAGETHYVGDHTPNVGILRIKLAMVINNLCVAHPDYRHDLRELIDELATCDFIAGDVVS